VILEDTIQRAKLAEILHEIYREPCVAGIGSRLHIVAVKKADPEAIAQFLCEASGARIRKNVRDGLSFNVYAKVPRRLIRE
jgi:hypothetical protein